MKTFTLSIFGASVLLAAIVIEAPVASAHSFPEQETPSAGQQLSAPPSEVTITFDAPIEKVFAKLEVIGADGKPATIGSPEVGASALTLSVKVAALKPGDYTVKWGVVCIDSHHTEGSYVFTVAGGG
ncbi:MAG TPA: copper resistance CopC family protein [Candidatus Binataceae bacterium]|nr:copper resistance CopC family protein [Candidatus Binataceae bacterium]